MKRALGCLLLFVFVSLSWLAGQVATGNPSFSSIGGGPFDAVNLGNLNVHFSIPVLHKAGRGMPFTYDLSYDSSIWAPVISGGTSYWKPSANLGWQSTWTGNAGYIIYSVSTQLCYDNSGHNDGEKQTWTNYVYHDAWGRVHAFSGQIVIYSGGQNCTGTNVTSFSSIATDGSGLTISVTNGVNAYLTTVKGDALSPAVVQVPPTSAQSSTKSDANGNFMNENTSGQFFDTLSSTVPVLTIGGTGTPSSPITFTYPAPSTGSSSCSPITNCASYTMNFTQYTVATNFAVSGIVEYGKTSTPLVSSIALPDGTSYSFTYEQTPGTCTHLSGTAANCVTGRIASVDLPTGGTITYLYTGGSNGIFSDGSTAGLTRILSPAASCGSGGCWQYSRVLRTDSAPAGPGSVWTTTVIDPTSNYTTINFSEDSNTTAPTYNLYETQRQVYQGSISGPNLLATNIHCYNRIYANCATAGVTTNITQTDMYSELPNGSIRLSEVAYNAYQLVTDDKEYGYGVTIGAAPSNTALVRETAISYASLGNGIVNKPSSVIVSDWSSGTAATLSSTSYAYDGSAPTGTSSTPQHTSVSGSRGNLTTVAMSVSSSKTLSKTYTYYDTGNPKIVTDVNTGPTTYAYSSATNPYNSTLTASCGNSFPTTITTALSRSMQWNCLGGVTELSTDENLNTIKTDYTDVDFWRPADVYDQESNETKVSYSGQTAVETALQNFNSGNS